MENRETFREISSQDKQNFSCELAGLGEPRILELGTLEYWLQVGTWDTMAMKHNNLE